MLSDADGGGISFIPTIPIHPIWPFSPQNLNGRSQSCAKEFATCTSAKFLRLVTCPCEEECKRQGSSVNQYILLGKEDLSLRMRCGLGKL